MNDPFAKSAQSLTDALLQLDRAITLAEGNVAAARQLGLPEAAELASRLPALTLRAREFLASVPSTAQPPRWGEHRRLLDQAASFQPLFAPYVMLGQRVSTAKQAQADRTAREKAAADEATRAQLTFECNAMLETARRRFSSLRQVLADMQLQRGTGFDDAVWQGAVRSLASIVNAQDVRIASAASSIRDRAFEDARSSLDQTLGELQGALDFAQRARTAANARAQVAIRTATDVATGVMPVPGNHEVTQPISLPLSQTVAPGPPVTPIVAQPLIRGVSMIEVRNGTVFRSDGTATLIGRDLDTPLPAGQPYINLSQACDPGEAEELGVSRRHAEIARQGQDFALRDLGSTNGTRLRRGGQTGWTTLQANTWTVLREGDTLQFGLLECSISFTR